MDFHHTESRFATRLASIRTSTIQKSNLEYGIGHHVPASTYSATQYRMGFGCATRRAGKKQERPVLIIWSADAARWIEQCVSLNGVIAESLVVPRVCLRAPLSTIRRRTERPACCRMLRACPCGTGTLYHRRNRFEKRINMPILGDFKAFQRMACVI